jgi:hypothetical protein
MPTPVLIRDLTGSADFSEVGVPPEAEERLRMFAMWYPFGCPVHHVHRDDPGDVFARLWTCETGVLRLGPDEEVLCLVVQLNLLEQRPVPGPGPAVGREHRPSAALAAQAGQALERVLSHYPETGIFAEPGGLGEASLRVYIPEHRVTSSPYRNTASVAYRNTLLNADLGALTQLWDPADVVDPEP